ncbi:MAG: dTDP-glucose 4,6-dehydratase [Candidatus Omnitrophica bacterium]|nr:dTDP-glucose 4,6-dehydratase [Candidatus Omnitrophota bacterium]
MRLLVTGGAGFIGAHFIRSWLTRHPDDQIVNLDVLTYAGLRNRLADVEPSVRYRFLPGDICDPVAVRQAMHGCQLVVHCAAETHVDRSITNAAPFLRTNVEGTYELLQAAKACGVERFIHVSTDEVYGPVLEGAVDERAPLAPRSPYAASKAAGDLLAQAVRATYGLPVLIVRPTNIFGPGQFPEKFIPLCITNSCDGLPLPIYGDGQQRRAWLFVGDVCEALQVVIERGRAGEIYNIAGGHEQTNLKTAQMILSAMGHPHDRLQFVPDRPGHDRRYAMTDVKLRALGWRAQTSFEQGVSQSIAWYREHADWWRPLAQRLREDPYHWLNRAAGSSPQPLARTIR